MDPQTQFCPNPACPARGLVGEGNIRVHSHQERRYRCWRCGRTFAATTGTLLYRRQYEPAVIGTVLTLLSHGCPPQAIVAAFAVDERTVAAWQQQAGAHCQRVHEHLVQRGQVDLGHVQADELWVKLVGCKVWLAMAIALPSRLWLGGVVSAQRDRALLTALLGRVRACARGLAALVCVDLVLPDGVLIGQVIKHYARRRVTGVVQRVVPGTPEAVAAVLEQTGGGTVINTAFIERLNATFRANLVSLVRRGRAIARTEATLTAAMWLVGCAYNLCWCHTSLRQDAAPGTGRKWVERTPAMAAGLTDHPWTMEELLHYRVPVPAWVAPTRRRRPPKLHLLDAAAAPLPLAA